MSFHRDGKLCAWKRLRGKSALGFWPSQLLLLMAGWVILPMPQMPAQQASGGTPKIVTLAHDPSPASLVAAKEALAQGDVVTMNGDDWVQFDGLLDLGLQPEIQDPTTAGGAGSQDTLRIMAAHLGSEHSVHEYECYTAPASKQQSNAQLAQGCQKAFSEWVGNEATANAAAPPEPLAGDYTPLFRIEQDYVWIAGTHYEKTRLYRVNDKEPTRDWYLVARDPASSPDFKGCTFGGACGWLAEKREFETALPEPFKGNADFKFFEGSPARNLGGMGSLTIGGGLSGFVPYVGVEYTLSWGQENVRTVANLQAPAKAANWTEFFDQPYTTRVTPTNSQYFQSHNALIYQVPEGTTSFYVDDLVRLISEFTRPNQRYNTGFHRRDTLAAPEFSVSTNTLTLLPKGKAYVRLTAAVPSFPYIPKQFYVGGLSWTAKLGVGTEGFAISQSEGSDSTLLTISATNAAAGAEGTLELNTNPPYAAASVVKSPLIVTLKVASGISPRVLLAGGQNWDGITLSSAELWDPATGKSLPTAPMTTPRRLHTATQLQDGRVLLTGGYGENFPQSSTEFFDPVDNHFSAGPNMNTVRAEHTATLIKSGPLAGDVLIAGGCDVAGNALNSAELYDPRTNNFTSTENMVHAHMRHTATVMADGRILIVGGTVSRDSSTGIRDAEIFDPSTRKWTSTASLQEGRQGHSATLLITGQVLVAGGRDGSTDPIATAELYTPTSKAFSYTLGEMNPGRHYQAAVPLLDGDVLLAGGYNAPYDGQRFDPSPETFEPLAGHMAENRTRPAATLLLNTGTARDKKVLFAGGVTPNTGSSGGRQLEIFDPETNTFAASGTMATPRSELTSTLVGTFY